MADDDNFLSRWSRRKAEVRQGMAPPAQPPAVGTAPVPPITPSDTVAAPDDGRLPAVAAAPPAKGEVGPTPTAASAEAPPPPTLDDVALLDRSSSYSRFVAPDVPAEVKNAALKKLFTDPHFNVMDGLDTYIEDYGQPDPLPMSMLRQMASAHALGLFRDDSVPGPNAPRAAGSHLLEPAAACEPAAAAPNPSVPSPPAGAGPEAPDAGAEALTPPEPAHEDTDLRLQPNDAAGCAGAEPGAGEDAGREH